jgi:hypothetical protein
MSKWAYTGQAGIVRDKRGYADLLNSVFHHVDLRIRSDLSWVPYTFIVGVSPKRNTTAGK